MLQPQTHPSAQDERWTLEQSSSSIGYARSARGALRIAWRPGSDENWVWTPFWMPDAQWPAARAQRGRVLKLTRSGEHVLLESVGPDGLGFLGALNFSEMAGDWLALDWDGSLQAVPFESPRLHRDLESGAPDGPVYESVQSPSTVFAQLADDTLVVDQRVVISQRGSGRLRHFFSPDLKKGRHARRAEPFDFLIRGVFEPSGIPGGMLRWDLSQLKRRGVRISSRIPSRYLDAVASGIRYWSRVFEATGLPGVLAEPTVSESEPEGPWPNTIRVEWVASQAKPGQLEDAYTDIVGDPRTGELLSAQVNLPEPLGMLSWEQARRVFERYQRTVRGDEPEASPELLIPNQDDAALDRVAEDHLLMITSHEFGHALGLRHNFAGSLGSSLRPLERDRAFAAYLSGSTLPLELHGAVTSTVLDYLLLPDHLLTGWKIRSEGAVFPYDRDTLGWLYSGTQRSLRELQIYCSDEQTNEFADCRRHDSGSSPALHFQWVLQRSLDQMHTSLLENFLRIRRDGGSLLEWDIEALIPDPDRFAIDWLARYRKLLEGLGPDAESAAVKFRAKTAATLGERRAGLAADLQAQWRRREFDRLEREGGGLFWFLSRFPTEVVSTVFETPRQTFFSEQEWHFIEALRHKFSEDVQQKIIYGVFEALLADPWRGNPPPGFAASLARVSSDILFKVQQGEFTFRWAARLGLARLAKIHLNKPEHQAAFSSLRSALRASSTDMTMSIKARNEAAELFALLSTP